MSDYSLPHGHHAYSMHVVPHSVRSEVMVMTTGDIVPVPDPTRLSTEALLREIAHVREMYDVRLSELNLRLQQRFDAQQKAIDAALISADLKTQALSDKIESLASYRDTSLGKFTGLSSSAGWIIAGIGLVATILTIIAVVSGLLGGK
jgi:hypothetical protein